MMSYIAMLLLAASLSGLLSNVAPPVTLPAPLTFAYLDTTTNSGAIRGSSTVGVNDNLSFGVNGTSVPATVDVYINGVNVAAVAVPVGTVSVGGVPYHVLAQNITAGQVGTYQIRIIASGFRANSLVITAQ